MDEHALQQLIEAARPGRVSVDLADRIAYSRDLWPRAQIWTMHGEPARHPPDAIAWPADVAGVQRLVAAALRVGLPIIPFGGGSGVAGATVPTWGGVILDTKGLGAVEEIDEDRGVCVAQAGINGEHLERQLNERGWTLGHFPSSIYCSCLGGWIAARSAGQMSSRYGKIEDMVLAVEVVLPTGACLRLSRDDAGPGWLQALVGSEGTLGVFTRAWLRIHRQPASRRFAAFSFRDVDGGLEAMRAILQAGLRPSVLRLYDAFDTLLAGGRNEPKENRRRKEERPRSAHPFKALALRVGQAAANIALRVTQPLNALAAVAPARPLLVIVLEGEPELTALELDACGRICLKEGGEDVGSGPAEHWYRRRYSISYKQSKVYRAGAFVDTMEVASTWERLGPLYESVRRAISPHAFVMAHFSHAYTDGCSIYFTFVGAAQGASAERRYLELWRHALQAAADAGATLSHHHGVGELKAGFMQRELGVGGRQLFRAIKRSVDPVGGMNPGKLWPRSESGHRPSRKEGGAA